LQAKTADTFGKIKRSMGKGILSVAPYLMKLLSIVGTIAMFIVGGGILVHGIPGSHDVLHHAEEVVRSFPVAGNILAAITSLVINTLVGILLGAIIVGAMSLGRRVFSKNS
jgi:predicted DNA repair protein MutK